MRRAYRISLIAMAVATLGLGAAPAAFGAPTARAPAAKRAVSAWSVDKAQSRIRFRSSFGGTAFEGGFSRWDAQIVFDPKDLAASKATVTVDLASATTGDQERDSALPTADWFNVAKAPRAVFTTSGFKALGGDKYLATGALTLRGVTRPVSLPFTLSITGDTAKMAGQATLNRAQFSVGQGQFQSAETVPFEVAVPIVIVAKRAD